jgi:ELWxxDGT repeat protein
MVWATDGTPSGTVLVSPGTVIAATRDYFYFVTAQGMFRSDGTAACTLQLGQSPQGDNIDLGEESFISGGARGETILILMVNRPFPKPPEIWGTDGSPSGTAPLPKLGGLSTMVPVYVASDTFLIFTKAVGATEYTLWRTDGTDAGTASIQSGLPEAPSSAAVVFGDSLYGTGWSETTSSSVLWSLPLISVEPGAAPGTLPGAAPPARVFMPLIDNPC